MQEWTKKKLVQSQWSDTRHLLQEPAEICRSPAYEELFKKEFQERPEVVQSFFEGLLKVPMEANADLDAQNSADELHAALQSLESSKALMAFLQISIRFSGL